MAYEAEEQFQQLLNGEDEHRDNNNDEDEDDDDDDASIRARMDIPPDGCFSWQKPSPLNDYEKTERGRAIASNQVPEDWAGLRLRSVRLRDLCNNEIKEYRDEQHTGCTFYYNIISERSTWKKPEDVLLRDKGVRGWNLIHKYAGEPIQLVRENKRCFLVSLFPCFLVSLFLFVFTN